MSKNNYMIHYNTQCEKLSSCKINVMVTTVLRVIKSTELIAENIGLDTTR